MKKVLVILSLMVTSIFLTSCDKVKDLNTVDFDATFSGDLDCATAGVKSNLLVPTFGGSVVIEPTSDPNVNIYLNKIKEYEIESIKATITSMSQENVTVTTAYLLIKNFQYQAQWDFQNELLTTGKIITLGNENGQWDTVSDILKDGQEFTILITGEADFSGVTFTIKVDIETKVTAEVI
ncbi:MAG: hypothetical protein HGA23_01250 [Bacteroidales bacterium]|nr:hypothetical protein [Bacteroidales bacterium]